MCCASPSYVEGDALVARLEPFDVVVAMRERTPLPRAVLERLPNLRLLVTTGMRNPAIDLAAAAARGMRAVPDAVLTPHLGYVTEATYDVFFRGAVEDVAAWLRGRPIRTLG